MCGIAGLLALPNCASWSPDRMADAVGAMTAAIAHRGPDDQGLWVEAHGRLALGHRRLSFVDLSARGKQPMHYNDRFVIVFNGEIYNHVALRRQLIDRGHRFASETDTEVIMAAVQEWGIEPALQRLSGMFAFALWDAQQRKFYLARDRLGEKPLFIGVGDGYLMFGSELRAVASMAGSQRLNAQAVSGYVTFGYVPAPHSMWGGIYKLPAASLLTLEPGQGCELHAADTTLQVSGGAKLQRYWFLEREVDAALAAGARTAALGDAQRLDQLDALVRDSVHLQMQSDVAMGTFLSGGIDSTVVTAAAQAQSSTPISTFTVKFDVPGYDESEHAAAISRHLKTAHHEITLTPQRLLASVPTLAASLDEPTANASYFPLHAMSAEARGYVKGILTGDGGDELFGGYNRYRLTVPLWRKVAWLPRVVRGPLAGALARVPAGATNALTGVARSVGLSGQIQPAVAAKKLARVLGSASLADSYQRLLRCWDAASIIADVPDTRWPRQEWSDSAFLARATLFDIDHYLPDDNLAKSDRATMAAGLEARVPLLDHKIVEFACALPDDVRIRGGVSKWLLRQLAYRYVPRELLERPKMGFTVPVDSWLRGPLHQWAGDLLHSRTLLDTGLLRPSAVTKAWQDFIARGAPLAWEMWSLTMYAAWVSGQKLSSSMLAETAA